MYPPIQQHRNQTLGEQVCTCCRFCEGLRYVPGAQVFAQCAAGDGSNSLVQFKSKASHQKVGVALGKVVRYQAAVQNVDKAAVVQGLALTVQLPAMGVAYIGSKRSNGYVVVAGPGSTSGNKVRYRSTKGVAGSFNASSTPPTVTWLDLTLPPRKGMRFSLKVRVNNQGVQRGTPLVFSGRIYQQLPANGLPYCSSASVNQTVRVK